MAFQKQANKDAVKKTESKNKESVERTSTSPQKHIFELIINNTQSAKISSADIIFDEEAGTQRAIRLVRGVSDIFLESQDSDIAAKLGLERLIFFNRRLEVLSTESAKLEFLRLTDQNADKTNRLPGKKAPLFREIKESDVLYKKSKLIREEQEAVSAAISASDEEMLAFAFTLGINVEQDVADVREEFILSAKAVPSFFIKHLNNPDNMRKMYIGKAILEKVISLDKIPGQAVWLDTGVPIVVIPVDRNPKEFLTEYSHTEEGKEFFDILTKLIA
jgi:hypothetical protein